jgi:hypothetical protein
MSFPCPFSSRLNRQLFYKSVSSGWYFPGGDVRVVAMPGDTRNEKRFKKRKWNLSHSLRNILLEHGR